MDDRLLSLRKSVGLRPVDALLTVRYKHHTGIGIEVHQARIATPGNQGLKNFLRTVVRNGADNVPNDGFALTSSCSCSKA